MSHRQKEEHPTQDRVRGSWTRGIRVLEVVLRGSLVLALLMPAALNAQSDAQRERSLVVSIGFPSGSFRTDRHFPHGVFPWLGPQWAKEFLYLNALQNYIGLPPILEAKYRTGDVQVKLDGGWVRYREYGNRYDWTNIEDKCLIAEVDRFLAIGTKPRKVIPFIGVLMQYSRRAMYSSYYYGPDGYIDQQRSDLVALMLPVGLSYAKNRFSCELQMNLSLATRITGRYIFSSYYGYEYERGTYYKVLLANEMVNNGYFLNGLMLKAGYAFRLKKHGK